MKAGEAHHPSLTTISLVVFDTLHESHDKVDGVLQDITKDTSVK
jgi:hypothetical protein